LEGWEGDEIFKKKGLEEEKRKEKESKRRTKPMKGEEKKKHEKGVALTSLEKGKKGGGERFARSGAERKEREHVGGGGV